MQVMAVLDAMPSSNLKPEDESIELDQNRVYRTTYMFSATMPAAVERLARKYLRRPVVVNIGSAGKATDNVTQRVVIVKAGPCFILPLCWCWAPPPPPQMPPHHGVAKHALTAAYHLIAHCTSQSLLMHFIWQHMRTSLLAHAATVCAGCMQSMHAAALARARSVIE